LAAVQTRLFPDGKRLVLAAWQGVIQFWDLESNRQIATLRACDHKQYVCYAAFLDENTLASVFADELRIWRAPSWAEIEAAKESISSRKEESK
jgi:WD40 repeat protein